MITKDELLKASSKHRLTPNVVEKDYVLGWMLAGIYANPALRKAWVFKGGTCLKKCYFEDYRFSEDLDFTLLDEKHVDESFLAAQFADISAWVYENVGIEMPPKQFKFDVYKTPRGTISCEGKIYYKSYFSSGKRSMPYVQLDLTAAELLVLPAVQKKMFHEYSDNPEKGVFVSAYSHEEVFGEKIRALAERSRPRDLYDVVNLYRSERLPRPNPAAVMNVLSRKCAYKGIPVPTMESLNTRLDDLQRNWSPMLKHQLAVLPSLDDYWGALPDFFLWLEGKGK